jgi:uncharacterized protein YbjQ (UPF0145 family)
MALGDFEVKGKLKVVGTTEMTGSIDLNGGALDTALVTNLNADLMDSAHKDTDGTLSGNSDSSIPTEKAVKTYVDTADALKANDNAVVKLTGAQTIADVKTFSSIPLLPADTIETADIQGLAVTAAKLGANAVTDAKCSKSLTGGSQAIAGSTSWVPPAGLYMFAVPAQIITEIYVSSAWRTTHDGYAEGVETGGFYWCDGTNIRLRNNWTASQTVYYLKLD